MTMAGVAAAAGVSAQTVYKAFGNKPALLKRVYDVTLVGDDEPVPFADRPEVAALHAETDARRLLAGYAAVGRILIERLGPLLRVLLAGARAGDPQLQEFVATANGERLVGATMTVQRLIELGPLREGVTPERARDAIWTLNSVEVWSLLTEQRGWSGDEYAEWVGRAMADAVLPYPD
jgi:AcrR family transcriptional regulator